MINGILNLLKLNPAAIGAEAVAVGTEAIATGINSVFDIILSPDISLEELAAMYSKSIDEIIIEEEKNGLTYVGGNFDIAYINNISFQSSFELYFQNAKKEWIKKEAKSKPEKVTLLKIDSVNALRKKKTVSFEINHPERMENK